MFDYKPKSAKKNPQAINNDDLGWLPLEFEPFEPNSKYSFTGRGMPSKDAWMIIKPQKAPAIGDLPQIIQNMVKATWKVAEPSAGAKRGNIVMGSRGMSNTQIKAHTAQTYHSQVRPFARNIQTTFPNNSAIASDWSLFKQIERTNALGFRGDTRTPHQVITQYQGFQPPNSRTDRYYLENNVYEAFNYYMNSRYNLDIKQTDFLSAVDRVATSPESKNLFIDYMMWRQIAERESAHLGRMVENECLKGYISTSRSIDTSITFGTKYNSIPGWLYLCVVHGGFIVPWDHQNLWGSEEAEIAQWGSIPADRIVGFRKLDPYNPVGPIFMRRSFRKSEPKAFKHLFDVMSGKTP